MTREGAGAESPVGGAGVQPSDVTTIRRSPEVLVLGGGIVGLCCAHVLSERGHRVEVLEALRPGSGATGAAAGMISPLVESDFDHTFARTCRTARDLWPAWAEWLAGESSVDLSFSTDGTLVPAYTTAGLQHLDRLQETAERLAENWERLDPDQVRELVPELRDGALAALLLPNEFSVDPAAVVEALRRILLRSGVLIHARRRVVSLRARQNGVDVEGEGWSASCDHVVIATGAGSGAIEGVGNLPIRGVRGQMISFGGFAAHKGPNLRAGGHYALRRGSELLVGATVEKSADDDAVTEAGRDELRDFALELFPGLQWKAVSRHWAGVRPAAPDELPVIGPLHSPRVVIATGHYRNGILLGPWTARVVADLIAHGRSTELPEEFSPNRF